MDSPTKAWVARILISVLPAGVAVVALSSYSLSEAVGEAYSTVLYLVVILGAEVAAIYAFQSEEVNAGDQLLNVLFLILGVLFWAAFVFYRVGEEINPSNPELERLIFSGLIGLIPMFLVFRTHLKMMREPKVVADMEKRRDKDVDELTKNKPTKGKVGDEEVDV